MLKRDSKRNPRPGETSPTTSSNSTSSSSHPPAYSQNDRGGTSSYAQTSNSAPPTLGAGNPAPSNQGQRSPDQNHNQSSSGRSHTHTRNSAQPTYPSGHGGYPSSQAPAPAHSRANQGYGAATASSSSRQQSLGSSYQTTSHGGYSPIDTPPSAQSVDGQLKPLLRAVRHLSADLEHEELDQSDPKGILQALKALKDCLQNGQETHANAQSFLRLRAILSTISTALTHPSDLFPIQNKIAGILGQLMDAEDGMPVIFGESEYDYDRAKKLLAKLENLVNNLGATIPPSQQHRQAAPPMEHANTYPQYKTRVYYDLTEAEFNMDSSGNSSSSQSTGIGLQQGFQLGSNNRIHHGVDMNASAPRMRFNRSGSATFWSGAEIGDPQAGYQTQTWRHQAQQHQGQQDFGQGPFGPGSGGWHGGRQNL